ncbi:MAG: hypothetical protein AAF490_29110 [Chloroflexota bacterium]
MAERNSIKILTELLDYVDNGSQLEILLSPANLLTVLEATGSSREEVQMQLNNGTKPGDLLLALFKQGHKPEALIDKLPKSARVISKKTPPSSTMKATSQPQSEQENRPTAPIQTLDDIDWTGSLLGKYTLFFAIGVVALTSFLPAMSLSGFLPLDFISDFTQAVLVSTILGGVAGLLYIPGKKISIQGAILGALLNAGILLAIFFYTINRQTILRLELLIPIFIGAIPGFGLYAILRKLSGTQ